MIGLHLDVLDALSSLGDDTRLARYLGISLDLGHIKILVMLVEQDIPETARPLRPESSSRRRPWRVRLLRSRWAAPVEGRSRGSVAGRPPDAVGHRPESTGSRK